MQGNAAGAATGETVRAVLDGLVLDAVRRTGAHSGALYLLDPGGEVLCPEAGSGVAPRFAGPVARLKPPPPAAPADAVTRPDPGRPCAWCAPR